MTNKTSQTNNDKAILHIDGDCFFASIEQAQNKSLRGKPIVTGAERGIVSSMSLEAKQLGITRADPLHVIKKKYPFVIIVPSDYEVYSIYSKRMFDIVRRYTDDVEEYSIDECFADLTGHSNINNLTPEQTAIHISQTLFSELGVSFSIGLAQSKVLAKLGSKWQKPFGFTHISASNRHSFLMRTTIDKVWNIGPKTTSKLNQKGINTALDLASLPEEFISHIFYKPLRDIWNELNGISVWPINTDTNVVPKSISKTKTFTPASDSSSFIFSQLSKNSENAFIKARRHGIAPSRSFIFLKRSDFTYIYSEVPLLKQIDDIILFIKLIKPCFESIIEVGAKYRASGVILTNLSKINTLHLDLFGEEERRIKKIELFKNIDKIEKKYGKHTVFIGSSFQALTSPIHSGVRDKIPLRRSHLLQGETSRRRIAVPFLGFTN